MTLAIRGSPFSRATSTGPFSTVRTSVTRPETVDRVTPVSPRDGQHLLDVAEEQRVGPDHQHALSFEGEPVGVEEVGGPVEGHGRLARTRSTLDHQDAGQRGPDDLVLLALDGGDDVGHPARPGPVQGGQQGGRAADGQVAQDQLARAVAVGVPGRTVSSVHCPGGRSPSPSVPSAARGRRTARPPARPPAGPRGPDGAAAPGPGDPGRWPGRRARRSEPASRPPADRDRRCGWPAGRCGRSRPSGRSPVRPGLGRRAVGPEPRRRAPLVDPVDPAEGQGLVPDVQLFEPGQAGADDHVPLGPRLERPAPAQVEHPLEHGVGVSPHGVEACVGQVHELLLSLKL